MLNPIRKILDTKFRTKLILMCVAAVVPVTLAGVYLLYSIIDVMRSNAANQAIFEADGLKTRLKDTVVTVSNISAGLSDSSDLDNLLNYGSVGTDSSAEYIRQAVSDYLGSYPQIDDVAFYMEKENFSYSGCFCYADQSVRQMGWYKTAAETDASRWQFIGIDGEERRLALAVPLRDKNGVFRGALTVSVSPDWLAELAAEVGAGVVMCTSEGLAFYSSVNGFGTGVVLPVSNIRLPVGISNAERLGNSGNPLEKRGETVVSYFNYDDLNKFFVFVVKPHAIYDNSVNNVITMYAGYISGCILLSVLITILFSSIYSRRIQSLKDKMHSVADGNFELTDDIKGSDEIYELYGDLKKMVDSMQSLINDAYKSKIQSENFKLNQMEAEFKALASQINPHFLYNTLETIRMKAYCNNDKETADLVKKLGKFMRRCLEVKDGMVTLESELEFTRSYLELQAARFGDRVSYSIYCEVDKGYMVLPLIIQPIVENAFVHGIESAKSNGRINVKVIYRGRLVEICVSDNGQGIAPDRLKELLEKLERNDTSSGKSIGLTNVNKRIKMYHGEEYGLSVRTSNGKGKGKGTTITITLPREVDEHAMKRLPEKYSEISGSILAKEQNDTEVRQ